MKKILVILVFISVTLSTSMETPKHRLLAELWASKQQLKKGVSPFFPFNYINPNWRRTITCHTNLYPTLNHDPVLFDPIKISASSTPPPLASISVSWKVASSLNDTPRHSIQHCQAQAVGTDDEEIYMEPQL